ncbi:MAG: glucose-6-phosphate isomerase, partial [Pseudomonadota bacterium]
MLKQTNPTRTAAWKKLRAHYKIMKNRHMKDLFREDGERFAKYTLRLEDILVDYSKNIITEETLALLLALAAEVQLSDAIEKMFSGDQINATEKRAVLHVALRNSSDRPIYLEGRDVMPDVEKVLRQMEEFSVQILSGAWQGYTGQPITDIVNIGIGGSDLGPVMVTEALRPYWQPRMRPHFVSNVDGTHIAETLKGLSSETTLFMIASKTFTTQETMTNAHRARDWFMEKAG